MRVLSSPQTFVYKFGLPWLFGLGALALAIDTALEPEPDAWPGAWAAAVLLGALALAVWLHTHDLKRVELDATSLVVRDHRSEISIPLREVLSVRQQNSPVPPVVEVRLTEGSASQSTVRFLPDDLSVVFGWLAKDGPVVKELRSAVERAWEEPA